MTTEQLDEFMCGFQNGNYSDAQRAATVEIRKSIEESSEVAHALAEVMTRAKDAGELVSTAFTMGFVLAWEMQRTQAKVIQ